jgi:hypothetical protein
MQSLSNISLHHETYENERWSSAPFMAAIHTITRNNVQTIVTLCIGCWVVRQGSVYIEGDGFPRLDSVVKELTGIGMDDWIKALEKKHPMRFN